MKKIRLISVYGMYTLVGILLFNIAMILFGDLSVTPEKDVVSNALKWAFITIPLTLLPLIVFQTLFVISFISKKKVDAFIPKEGAANNIFGWIGFVISFVLTATCLYFIFLLLNFANFFGA